MTDLLGAARLREVLARHGVKPSRSLGQNFVIDPNTIRKVLDVAGISAEDVVLEIGAGAGSLTLGLCKEAREVIAIEKDPRLVPVLAETLANVDNVRVVRDDAGGMALGELAAAALVANLPYNVAAPLVIKVLEDAPSIRRLTVMTQREVGERLAASPGNKTYGRTSVMVGLYASARVAAKISRRAFWPIPNVDSVLVQIERRSVSLYGDAAAFGSVVRACFASRRKTVRNGIAALVGDTDKAQQILEDANVAPTARPEVLAPEDFARIALVAERSKAS